LPPDYILDNWTEELFNLMVEKLVERKKRETGVVNEDNTVSVETLAATSSGMVEVKHGN